MKPFLSLIIISISLFSCQSNNSDEPSQDLSLQDSSMTNEQKDSIAAFKENEANRKKVYLIRLSLGSGKAEAQRYADSVSCFVNGKYDPACQDRLKKKN